MARRVSGVDGGGAGRWRIRGSDTIGGDFGNPKGRDGGEDLASSSRVGERIPVTTFGEEAATALQRLGAAVEALMEQAEAAADVLDQVSDDDPRLVRARTFVANVRVKASAWLTALEKVAGRAVEAGPARARDGEHRVLLLHWGDDRTGVEELLEREQIEPPGAPLPVPLVVGVSRERAQQLAKALFAAGAVAQVVAG